MQDDPSVGLAVSQCWVDDLRHPWTATIEGPGMWPLWWSISYSDGVLAEREGDFALTLRGARRKAQRRLRGLNPEKPRRVEAVTEAWRL